MLSKEHINLANLLTFSRIILGFVFLTLFLLLEIHFVDNSNAFLIETISFFVFIIAIITDGLDGYFARKNKIVTDFGKHFDPLADSIFFVIVFFTFLIIGLMPIYFFIILLLRESFMHFFLRPYVKRKGSTLPASIYGKIKTVFQSVFSLIILFLMIVKSFLNLLGIDSNNSFILKIEWIKGISFVFFAIIVFLSLLSLLIYLINLNKIVKKS